MKMKQTLGLISLLFLSPFYFSQSKVDPTNCRDGENVEYCTHHKKLAELKKNPDFLRVFNEDQVIFQAENSNKSKQNGQEKATIYKIPIVFHILHNGGIENISRAQVLDQISILNRDYRRLNADANSVQPPFQGMPADIEIEFVLATKAPNGTCFSGITHTKDAITSDGSDGDAQVDAIKAGNDVYQGEWPGNKYLNIFVCSEIGGAAGYTFNPSNWGGTSMTNGIWILHSYVGSIETSSILHSRALTHEVGHWLNLSHTWGPNNNPGNTSSCADDDGVSDTPVCIGVSSCALSSNTCNDLTPASGVTSSWTTNVVDNVENYMDYSYCSKMFTPGQKTRMRTALQTSVGGRNNLWTTNNLNATGTNGNATLCKADFTTDKTVICAGDSVQFSDISYSITNGWTWSLTGSSSATSNIQNPKVAYNTPGFYSVTLTATDGTTSLTETKTSLIQVLPAAGNLPFFDGFENYTTLNNNNNWAVYNNTTNNTFSLYNGTGASGNKCVKLGNFGQVSSNVDELLSSPVDLSTLDSASTITLSFKYAYRKVLSTNIEYLKVYASTNCGESWNIRKTISGNTLSSVTSSSAWTPSSASDWVTVHVTNLSYLYFVDNFRYKFRFEGNGGNNLFLDDINLYEGSPSNTNVLTGISENNAFTDFSIFPNPTDNELNIEFNVENDQEIILNLVDLTGKTVLNNLIKAKNGSNLVILDTEKLNAGMYLLNIKDNNTVITKQIVIK